MNLRWLLCILAVATSKLHVSEEYAMEDLRRHKRLGLFDESQVERKHHTSNKGVFSFVPEYEELIQDSRRSRRKIPPGPCYCRSRGFSGNGRQHEAQAFRDVQIQQVGEKCHEPSSKRRKAHCNKNNGEAIWRVSLTGTFIFVMACKFVFDPSILIIQIHNSTIFRK